LAGAAVPCEPPAQSHEDTDGQSPGTASQRPDGLRPDANRAWPGRDGQVQRRGSRNARPRGRGGESSAREGRQTRLDFIAAIFRDDDLPDEIRERLLREGFVRVDATGLLEPDRYVLPNQIEAVVNDQVRLKVGKAALIAAP
jgi:hypothetical protein